MKRLLVLGAGFLQSFIIKKSVELGYYTLAIDKNTNSIGFEHAHEFDVIDISDLDKCLDYAKKKNIDGVITGATDYGVLSNSYIAKKLELPGLNYKAARLIKNKYLVRKELMRYNTDSMKHLYFINKKTDLNLLANSIEYPLMIKPIDGSGSKGVYKLKNSYDLYKYCFSSMSASLQNEAYLEDFIEGIEYGVESVVYNDEIYVLSVIKKEMTNPPIYAELGHSLPNNLENEDLIIEVVKNTIKSLNLDFGAVNMDILLSGEKVYVIDIGARMGGNLIGSHLIPEYTGFNYIEYLIKISLGEDVSNMRPQLNNRNNSVSTAIMALKPGRIKSLINFRDLEKEYNVQIFFNKKIGDIINTYRNNLDGCGYIVSIEKNIDLSYTKAKTVKNIIDKNIIREEDVSDI